MQIKVYVFKDIRFISDFCSITCLFLIALVAAGLKGHCPLVQAKTQVKLFSIELGPRIARPSAKLGVTFVGLNLHPGMGCTHFLPKIVGPQVAARMLLTGELVTGEQVGWQFNTALSKLHYSTLLNLSVLSILYFG